MGYFNSFKPSNDIIRDSLSFPIKNFTFDNYIKAFNSDYNIFNPILYIFISTCVVIAALIIAGFCIICPS